MPRSVDLPELQELIAAGAQLVEVMPAEDHAKLHLPGAISLPLAELEAGRAGVLDRRRPIVVYCYDGL